MTLGITKGVLVRYLAVFLLDKLCQRGKVPSWRLLDIYTRCILVRTAWSSGGGVSSAVKLPN